MVEQQPKYLKRQRTWHGRTEAGQEVWAPTEELCAKELAFLRERFSPTASKELAFLRERFSPTASQ